MGPGASLLTHDFEGGFNLSDGGQQRVAQDRLALNACAWRRQVDGGGLNYALVEAVMAYTGENGAVDELDHESCSMGRFGALTCLMSVTDRGGNKFSIAHF